MTFPLRALSCPRLVLLSTRLRLALRDGLVGLRLGVVRVMLLIRD
jgi:hypothetical protein